MPKPINISASRGAAILGLSDWSTPVNVWLQIMESRQPGFCEKNKFLYPEFEETAGIRWGKAFESAVIELAEQKQNLRITNREKLYSYDYVNIVSDVEKLDPTITCHIDGWYGINGSDPLHEGKTTSSFYYRDHFGEPGTDQVPIEYQIQCQHQMICTGAEKVILSVLVFPKRVEEWEEMGWHITDGYLINLDGNFPTSEVIKWAEVLNEQGYFHQYEINANPELHEQMIKNYAKFWNENVLGETPPIPQSYDDIKALVREPVGTIVANERLERITSEYKQIKGEIGTAGALAKRADYLKVEILKEMDKSEHIDDDDSRDKYILRNRAGKKIASYGKNKNGVFIFR